MRNLKPLSTSEQAEAAFYLAFEQSDIEMMMALWSKNKNTVCVHPGGPRLEGLKLIRSSWEEIFSYEQGIKFDVIRKIVLAERGVAVHHVIESISINGEPQSEIITTNVYYKTKDGWRMVMHHASPNLRTEVHQPDLDEEGEWQTVH